MEAIRCPSPSLPSRPFLSDHAPQPRRGTQLLFPIRTPKRRYPLRSRSTVQTQALNNALTVAANPPAAGGNISVLIPISAVMLFMFWITNFVVPGMISKDFQSAASEAEKAAEQEAEKHG
ncbi:uncharacterized protein LOC120110591 [Phoenix dactylifera]|uniref:Uncharacterized protein LOC120110591 n=1 Tax=Phoenix dactylifera TaxID=42345 RepID=A0A8B9A5N4_PHODC|nr:uncharacterized protein LOC120110591 [Phoenix dactylifera]